MAVVRLVVQICGQLCPDLQRKHGVNAALAASFNPEYQQTLALQLLFWDVSESMGNHDSEVVDASSVD